MDADVDARNLQRRHDRHTLRRAVGGHALKIAIDALNLLADERGMGRYVRSALRVFEKDGENEYTLLSRDPRQAKALAQRSPLRSRTLREARHDRFDTLWYPWNGIRFSLCGRRVVTIYDDFAFANPARSWVARRREQRPIMRAVREADTLTTISHWSAARLACTFRIDASRFTVVTPQPDAFWRPTQPARRERPYILVVGGPEERKNLPLFFGAFASAFAAGDTELVVAGTLSAPDEASLHARVAHFERVRPDDEQLRGFYSGALAVAVPSRAEGYGLMVVEAMACGAPVIAADGSGIAEACGGAALLVPPEDTVSWAQALARLADDGALREELKQRSLARVASCDRDAVGKAIRELLRRSRAAAR